MYVYINNHREIRILASSLANRVGQTEVPFLIIRKEKTKKLSGEPLP